MALVKRIDHVGVIVKDLEETAAAIAERFGLKLAHVEDLQDGTARLGYLDVGGSTLQLVQPLGPGAVAQRLAVQGEGLDHICFLVPNLFEARRALDVVDETVETMGGRGAPVCFLPDRKAGVLIELTQPVESSGAREEEVRGEGADARRLQADTAGAHSGS